MAQVKPFQGWRYDSKQIKNLSDVVVPPYDVISDDDLKNLKKLNPYNFSNIILSEGENKHTKAAHLFKTWQFQNLIKQDPTPCFYFYEQTFTLDRYELFCQNFPKGSEKLKMKRTGFFARVKVEDYENKVILPHEKTFSGPKADRYILMTEAQGNMEPVFLGYDSQRVTGSEFEKMVGGQTADVEFTDAANVHHRLWCVSDSKVTQEVESALKDSKLYILDGHHRYETALKFSKDHQGENPSYDYVLAQVCAFKQPGTIILPTHRLVKDIPNFSWDGFKNAMKDFSFEQVNTLDQLEELLTATKENAFGVKLASENKYYLMKDKRNHKVKPLDLDVLHHEVLVGAYEKSEIAYVKSIPEFEQRLKQSEFQLGFLVRPSTCDDVMDVAHNSGKMPHKSTFFYPKIPSGLVVNLF